MFLGSYQNGNYKVFIDKDGTKIRMTKEDKFIPSFAENCDVKITNKCSQGCKFCYEGCKATGKDADLLNQKWIDSLHPYTELAINGNDMNHPQLIEFLKRIKERKVICNITVNYNQYKNNLDKLKKLTSEKFIYGVGVSLVENCIDDDFFKNMNSIPNTVVHSINGILTKEEIEQMKGHHLKLLILGYKTLRRGKDFYSSYSKNIIERQKYLYDNISDMAKYFDVISFDNLSISQLKLRRFFTDKEWEKFYMGDDGDYTFYIDMVEKKFGENSISTKRWDILDDYTIDDMFKIIKEERRKKEI